jgi:hypothetical protein
MGILNVATLKIMSAYERMDCHIIVETLTMMRCRCRKTLRVRGKPTSSILTLRSVTTSSPWRQEQALEVLRRTYRVVKVVDRECVSLAGISTAMRKQLDPSLSRRPGTVVRYGLMTRCWRSTHVYLTIISIHEILQLVCRSKVGGTFVSKRMQG